MKHGINTQQCYGTRYETGMKTSYENVWFSYTLKTSPKQTGPSALANQIPWPPHLLTARTDRSKNSCHILTLCEDTLPATAPGVYAFWIWCDYRLPTARTNGSTDTGPSLRRFGVRPPSIRVGSCLRCSVQLTYRIIFGNDLSRTIKDIFNKS